MNKKILIGSIGVFFIVFLMISSATAVPCSNSQSFNRLVNKNEKINTLFKIINEIKVEEIPWFPGYIILMTLTFILSLFSVPVSLMVIMPYIALAPFLLMIPFIRMIISDIPEEVQRMYEFIMLYVAVGIILMLNVTDLYFFQRWMDFWF